MLKGGNECREKKLAGRVCGTRIEDNSRQREGCIERNGLTPVGCSKGRGRCTYSRMEAWKPVWIIERQSNLRNEIAGTTGKSRKSPIYPSTGIFLSNIGIKQVNDLEQRRVHFYIQQWEIFLTCIIQSLAKSRFARMTGSSRSYL